MVVGGVDESRDEQVAHEVILIATLDVRAATSATATRLSGNE